MTMGSPPPEELDSSDTETTSLVIPIRDEAIHGLPRKLSVGTRSRLYAGGTRLALAMGADLTVFELCLDGSRRSARVLARHELHGVVRAVSESSFGLVAAVEHDGVTDLLLIDSEQATRIIELPGARCSLTAAGAQAYAVTEDTDGRGRLVRVNLRQRAITARHTLEHAEVSVAVDPSGEHVAVTDRIQRTVHSWLADLRPARGYRRVAAAALTDEPPHGGRCCCCVRCPDRRADEPAQPPDGQSDPERGDPDSPRDGQTGVPTAAGGTVVGHGDRVDHHPAAGSDRDPCGRRLLYFVDEIRAVASHFLAVDAGARRAALLSADMNLLEEWQFGRGGALVLTAPDSTGMVMHLRDTGAWVWRDAHEIAKDSAELVPSLSPPLESATFIGQKTYALSYGQRPAPSKLGVLVLPVIEGSQTFSSPNLDGFGAFVRRRMGPMLKDFYDENSFGAMNEVSVSVFGAGVGPRAGPLKLPRARLKDYYFPEYEPARLELVKHGATAAAEVVLDGRESLTIQAAPLTGGRVGATVKLPFYALGLQVDQPRYPAQVKFLGTERLTLDVVTPAGKAKTLSLSFPAKVIDIAGDADVAPKVAELGAYLDAVMSAAETAAGITPRLFAAPKVARIQQTGADFGRLSVLFSAATPTGPKLRITSTSSVHPGGDPLGLSSPMLGTIAGNDAGSLSQYLQTPALLAQDAVAGFGYSTRLLADPATAVDPGVSTMTTTISISNREGGPGADVKLVASAGLETLFDTSSAKPNSATTFNNRKALRDGAALQQDAYSAAVDRLLAAKDLPEKLHEYAVMLVLPIEPGVPNAADPEAVLPSEAWNVTPLDRPFTFRGQEQVTTVAYSKNAKIQTYAAWALVFMPGGVPDHPMILHEVGHAIGFGDLYYDAGYRNELAYMNEWAMMAHHPSKSHHCGYHKLQAGWIPIGSGTEDDYGRVFPLGLPDADVTRTWEILLVPVELWRPSLEASARVTFGVDSKFPVAQLAAIDFGGDGMTFGLIEARQPGANYSKSLPGGGGVLITNAISWVKDERFATNTWYRRQLQLLNPDNVLRNKGDSFDLAMAPELPVKGMTVTVVDTKLVEGDAQVYRVRVTRANAEFVDLYFQNADPYYKNPDLWLDWPGNNHPTPATLDHYAVGTPTDQGDAIRVHPTAAEKHYVVARLRNRGQVDALDVKLNFFYFEPPGAGDGQKPMDVTKLDQYKAIGTVPAFPKVPANNVETIIPLEWNVPAGFAGHTCLLVQIEDYRIPRDSKGAALGSEDVWQVNNHAQKNVSKYESLAGSPYAPVEFDFSVFNAGVSPEFAYLEPEGLPYGMKLTVTPPRQTIPQGSSVVFHCMLELDEGIIRAGCENDQRFRVHAWRADPESSARWGGVEYEIRPREKVATTLTGWWDAGGSVTLKGKISPDPGGGDVYVRLAFEGQQARWVKLAAAAGGTFQWSGAAPSGSFKLATIADFEGNRKYGSSASSPLELSPPPALR